MSLRRLHAVPPRLRDIVSAQIGALSPDLAQLNLGSNVVDDMLGWLCWTDSDIASVLTELCAPFWLLRAWEFEAPYGDNLIRLRSLSTALSFFVASSVLVAACAEEGRKLASSISARWIAIMRELIECGNYHAAAAVQSGLQRSEVTELPWVFDGLGRKDKAFKSKMYGVSLQLFCDL